jgi:hypothetical protein
MKITLLFLTLVGFGGASVTHQIREFKWKEEKAVLKDQVTLLQDAQEEAKMNAEIDSIKAKAQVRNSPPSKGGAGVVIKYKPQYIYLPLGPVHDSIKATGPIHYDSANSNLIVPIANTNPDVILKNDFLLVHHSQPKELIRIR